MTCVETLVFDLAFFTGRFDCSYELTLGVRRVVESEAIERYDTPVVPYTLFPGERVCLRIFGPALPEAFGVHMIVKEVR